MDTTMTLNDFLVWIASGPGALYLSGAVASLLLANWQWFVNLPKFVKSSVPLLLAIGLAVGSQMLLGNSDFLSNPLVNQIFNMLMFYLGSQHQFMKIRSVGYGLAKKR